jgi:hypothetical protein
LIFLSYAEEDEEAVRQMAAVLRRRGVEFYDWQGQRGGRFIEAIERALSRSDAFIAVMSPHFLASSWCRMERELAIQRELDLRAADPDFTLIHVLQVAETPYADSGFLRRYDWHDLTSPGSRSELFNDLVDRLIPGIKTGSEHPDFAGLEEPGSVGDRVASLFRNRREELDRVLHGLTSLGGPHFWVVVAPPQLGKTWFLDRLSAELTGAGQGSAQWVTRLVDLRDQPLELRGDASALIAQLFGQLIAAGHATPRHIAQGISRSGRPYLCLLDSAELLTEDTASALRAQLSSIYRLVQKTGNADVRLGVVVATRREQDWRGVSPDPRLTVLSLTEFSIDIVLQALHDFAASMSRVFGHPDFRAIAGWVHSLSEGLPGLLVPCLQWIRKEEWLELERLGTEELFAEIAHPYIEERLLAQDSLYPEADERPHRWRQGRPGEQLYAVAEAFRLLVPYRLFTQSHLRHHVGSDRDFAEALEGLDWSVEDMWGAISGSALLRRPLDEPWQEIYPAIRRLLFRYCYQGDDARAHAHREARKFVEVWSESQAGKEQVMGLLESLWHEACALRLSQAGDMEDRLSDSAGKLTLALRESAAYTPAELRTFAAGQMREDDEFQQAVDNVDGLFNRLTSIIREPPREQ